MRLPILAFTLFSAVAVGCSEETEQVVVDAGVADGAKTCRGYSVSCSGPVGAEVCKCGSSVTKAGTSCCQENAPASCTFEKCLSLCCDP
jgi:hypothetical protein